MRAAHSLTRHQFSALVESASKAPSSDNMQPWEFEQRQDSIEVYCAQSRLLRIDVGNMFTWISIGAAIQNMVNAAAPLGLHAAVKYGRSEHNDEPAAVLSFEPGNPPPSLARAIPIRRTNRRPFSAEALQPELMRTLSDSTAGIRTSVHWSTDTSTFRRIRHIDAIFSAILLAHKPLFDGLFDTIRFSRKELERTRLGMDLKSLEIPYLGYLVARALRQRGRAIGRIGLGRVVSKVLSSRLTKAAAVCLFTCESRNPAGYMEAGRAMQQLWLAATEEGLSVHPYGVIPQYLTMAELTPGMFPPKDADTIIGCSNEFYSCFPAAREGTAAVMLRIGRARRETPRNDVRLRPAELLRVI